MSLQTFFLLYIVVINIIAFITMLYDKKMAINYRWRVPEKEIFILALLLGSIGVYAGMYIFRHKTQHKKFSIGIPIILVINVISVIRIIQYLFM